MILTFKGVQFTRWLLIVSSALLLSACVYWIRAYETYLQFNDFDHYFSLSQDNEAYSLNFKEPIMLSDDFVSLAKLYPSDDMATNEGRRWRYWFRKVDATGQLLKPEVKFYCDLNFDKENRLIRWSFSSLFLQIAPADFLTVSLRSIGGAEIDKEKQQLRADTSKLPKITSPLPHKNDILKKLGRPLLIKNDPDDETLEVASYHFLLETYHVEEGYEDRPLNEIQLSFDKKNQRLMKMSGRFAGLKISIDYRHFLDNH